MQDENAPSAITSHAAITQALKPKIPACAVFVHVFPVSLSHTPKIGMFLFALPSLKLNRVAAIEYEGIFHLRRARVEERKLPLPGTSNPRAKIDARPGCLYPIWRGRRRCLLIQRAKQKGRVHVIFKQNKTEKMTHRSRAHLPWLVCTSSSFMRV